MKKLKVLTGILVLLALVKFVWVRTVHAQINTGANASLGANTFTGTQAFPNGTASAPSIVFAIGAQTGLYGFATNAVGVASSSGGAAAVIGQGAGPGVRLPSNAALQFNANSNDASAAGDTGLGRGAAGVITVDTSTIGNALGTIKPGLYASGTNCLLGGAAGTTSPAGCVAAAAGKIAIPASQTTYTVNTTAVTANSEIMITQISDNAGLPSSPTCSPTAGAPIQSARVAATSFTFVLPTNAAITCYQYWIIN